MLSSLSGETNFSRTHLQQMLFAIKAKKLMSGIIYMILTVINKQDVNVPTRGLKPCRKC